MVAVLAIDAGTTGVRTRALFSDGRPPVSSYREFPQYFPQPGWVEHDANEIWEAVVATFNDVTSQITDDIAAIGITNQRETVVAWSRSTSRPLHRAIVWQDRRTAQRCSELEPHLGRVREITGLVLDPYFSGTKAQWLLNEGGVENSPDLAIGTIDSWIIWKLTNGTSFVTDASNASRTMLFDINSLSWSDEMCELLHVPRTSLARIVHSSERVGVTSCPEVQSGIPISGIAGDQQAALFGQACFEVGMAKNTYGTGSFVLLNVGAECPMPTEGMLTTVAWTLSDGTVAYALEGSIFITGAAVQWLRDGLGIIDSSSDVQSLAASVPDSGGVFVVPAFAGLGSPWWDPYARGTIVGITRGTTRAHIAKATVEAMSFQTRDVIEAMADATGVHLSELRVDGGASANDDLMQHQANELGVRVVRPLDNETTAVGAAYLAGLAEGVWSSLDDIASTWSIDTTFTPEQESGAYPQWRRAVERSLKWEQPSRD